jgi:hypothetical protein
MQKKMHFILGVEAGDWLAPFFVGNEVNPKSFVSNFWGSLHLTPFL